MIDLPPLPASVRALIDAEAEGPAGGDRTAIRGRVLASLGIAGAIGATSASTAAAAAGGTAGAGGTAAAGTAAAGVAGKVVAVVLAVGAVGGGAALIGRDDPPPRPSRSPTAERVDPPIARPPASVSAETPDPVAVPVVTSPATIAPAPPPVARPSVTTRAPAPPVEDQATLLRRAWDELGRGEPAIALAAVERDATTHPVGPLAEEREALRIDALLRLGRTADARAHAQVFAEQYPHSVHRALVTRALEMTP